MQKIQHKIKYIHCTYSYICLFVCSDLLTAYHIEISDFANLHSFQTKTLRNLGDLIEDKIKKKQFTTQNVYAVSNTINIYTMYYKQQTQKELEITKE